MRVRVFIANRLHANVELVMRLRILRTVLCLGQTASAASAANNRYERRASGTGEAGRLIHRYQLLNPKSIMMTILSSLALASCSLSHDVIIANPCNRDVSVQLNQGDALSSINDVPQA